MASSAAVNAIKANAAARGIEVAVTESIITDANGNPVLDKNGEPIKEYATLITHVPDVEQEALHFFTPNYESPCQEIAVLQAKYKAELSKHKNCSDCTRGKLVRKYLPLVKDALRRHKLQHSGSAALPGPTAKSTGGSTEKRSLLQRASAGLATLFKRSV